MRKRRTLGAIATVLLLSVAACNQSTNATVRFSDFEIKPSGFKAVVGQPFTLTLINAGRVRHNLQLDPAVTDIPLPAALNPGDIVSVTFTPRTAGTSDYWCAIPGHLEAGMKGTLTVEDR